ncbi:lactate utilization protein B [Sulfurospirillum multivorans]|uniref:Lactate utilization protein B n=2 Tax=Sulfurospirillum multivorans TaxID=66821 RepID=A0AA86DZC1_SULMK|nr:lactate utilization protein B [Sulfurospirillum multivorans]AHJ12300.1 lactate utilization protein B [Sulfurospirillum multivorans DSM 12446]QEH05800.1 lactate utilization protein B [Sulfurospirillum multivorans]
MSHNHSELADKFASNVERMKWHDKALWFVRVKRDTQAKSLDEWEELRNTADKIKSHTLSHLDEYLEQFEKNALARGIRVHWAKDAKEHNEIVLDLLRSHNAKMIVKSKSMLTEECHLNPYLEEHGIEVVDTDLGERIVQLRNEPPSHIVLPAIHLKKEDVGTTFEKFLNTQKGNSDPTYLTRAARAHLREKFVGADASMTGVNFAIAETGGIVVCTNEGNADLGASLPKLHIACMGIEKIIPRLKDLSIFTRLLARSATGQPVTTYTSHYHGAVEGGEMHVVIVDNGRSKILADKRYVKSLQCIRCGACLNTCPIYRRSGGYSYGYVIPGPIGSTLAPSRDLKKYYSLPFACSLCFSCSNICPVKVDLAEQLYLKRQDVVDAGYLSPIKLNALKMATWLMCRPKLMDFAGLMARKMVPILPRVLLYSKFNLWGKNRELPPFPKNSFKELYKAKKGIK